MHYNKNRLPSRYVRRLGSASWSLARSQKKNRLIFSQLLKEKSTKNQLELLNFFEIKYQNKNEISLFNSDFYKGTYRIRKPGIYVLRENISFNPIHLFPLESEKKLYPTGINGAYHLGFFAAITIETEDVILDLNGYTITQSKRHNLLQRFFSIVELADSPFIPNQGPHSFTKNINSAKRCLIMNGNLDNSSHHGIHGNSANDIVIHNVNINDFEVAGIALNGSTNVVINSCKLKGKNKNIPVLSSFSQALFTARVLQNLNETKELVYRNIDNDIQTAFSEIMNYQNQSTYFKNNTGQYDGNMYGIVLNVNGVVINKFLSSRDKLEGNRDILIFNVEIKSIDTHPVEILGLPVDKNLSEEGAYGAKRMVGVFGDVFDIEKVMNTNKIYTGNSLSDAQIFLADKYPEKGTLNINKDIVKWANNKSYPLPHDFSTFVPEGDSMGHFMKGNIGLFISGGTNITVDTVLINGVKTNGIEVGNSILLNDDQRYFHGSDAYGILTTASEKIEIIDSEITNIISKNGITKKIEHINN